MSKLVSDFLCPIQLIFNNGNGVVAVTSTQNDSAPGPFLYQHLRCILPLPSSPVHYGGLRAQRWTSSAFLFVGLFKMGWIRG